MNGKLSGVLAVVLVVAGMFSFDEVFPQAQVVPCQLTNADQDTLRLFPERTNYRKEFLRIDEVGTRRGLGPEKLYRELETRLGDKWDPVWETRDIPYVFYEILKGTERIGWVFGANQGWPGADNCQIMCRFDLDDRIVEFYFQKLPAAVNLRAAVKYSFSSPEFYSQFIGLTLEHFYVHEQMEAFKVEDKNIRELDMIARMKNPVPYELGGFEKTLRGMKMIFVLIDDFEFNNRVKKDEVFAKTKYVIDHKSELPWLECCSLEKIKKVFPGASRSTVDLIWWKGKTELFRKRMNEALAPEPESGEPVYPVYVVYRDEVYKEPFVRGVILGYALPLNIDTPGGRVPAMLAIGAEGKDKGKILALQAGDSEFPRLKGLSLVQFYTKDLLTIEGISDEKLDRIAAAGRLKIGEEDLTEPVLRAARLGLVTVDEFYFGNFFKQEEIAGKIREYLGEKAKGKPD